jgi:hypothetical protein
METWQPTLPYLTLMVILCSAKVTPNQSSCVGSFCHFATFPHKKQKDENHTLEMIHYLQNKVGVHSRFCKCPRIGNVLKPKGLKGPRALKFYQSAGFCKIYCSHFILEVMTFLRKIQNRYFYTKNVVKLW